MNFDQKDKKIPRLRILKKPHLRRIMNMRVLTLILYLYGIEEIGCSVLQTRRIYNGILFIFTFRG